MIESHMRVKIQPLFDKCGRILLSCNFTANAITVISFVSGIFSGLSLALHHIPFALFFLWLSGFCDVMDGTVARLSDSSKKVGAYIDLISDRMVEAAVILGFTFFAPRHYLVYILFLIALLLHFSTFAVAGSLFGNSGKKSMHYDKSLVERAEAFIFFSLMMLFPHYIFELFLVFNFLVFASAITRFFRVLNYAKMLDQH